MNEHIKFLIKALSLAQQRKGFCAPNPAVGAIAVKDGRVLAEGMHYQAGAPHAEVVALAQLDPTVQGVSLYVTLEPCCHYGKTPPCVDLIIKHNIKAVYFAFKDPNPIVCGQGQAQLIRAGVACEHVSVKAMDDFYQSYLYWTLHRTPWVTLKMAVSQDGKIAGFNGEPVQLTGPECQRLTHQCRFSSDAILTTVNTIRNDDPQLNVRLDKIIHTKPLYVLDSQLNVSRSAAIFKTGAPVVLLHSKQASEANKNYFSSQDVRCVLVKDNLNEKKSGLDLFEVLKCIGQDGIHDLWVEAGARCFNGLYSNGLINCFILYLSSKRLGHKAMPLLPKGLPGNGQLMKITSRQLGPDVVFELNQTGC